MRVAIMAEAACAAEAQVMTERHRSDFVVTDVIQGETNSADLVEALFAIHPPPRSPM